MEKREIIQQTIKNMLCIYNDVKDIVFIIEGQMGVLGFSAIGSNAITWEQSASLHRSDHWLAKWFVRAYKKNESDSLKTIGYCIHLGGYDNLDCDDMPTELPLMSVSLLTPEIEGLGTGNHMRDCFWWAGWDHSNSNFEPAQNDRLVRGVMQPEDNPIKTISFFLDPLILVDENAVLKFVSEPLAKLYDQENKFELQENKNFLSIISPNQSTE